MLIEPILQLQTDMQVVEPGKFVFNIENAAAVNHVVIFMTGQEAFPDGMGGAGNFCYTSNLLAIMLLNY